MDYDLAFDLVCRLMMDYFDGDIDMTNSWLQTSDPFLRYVSPIILMRSGLHENVLHFVNTISKKRDVK